MRLAARANDTAQGRALPAFSTWDIPHQAAYCHYTANETADGAAFAWPDAQLDDRGVPLVCDMTSSFLIEPVDLSRLALVYAGAQKNIGPAGMSVLLVREDLLGRAARHTPAVLDYTRQAAEQSCLNTPPTFALALAALVFEWIAARGGLAAMARANAAKAALLDAAVADSGGFYRHPVAPAWRSRVNVCFTLSEAGLTGAFLDEAERRGPLHLRGHPQVGGVRASLYNAVPEAAVAAPAACMRDFARCHG